MKLSEIQPNNVHDVIGRHTIGDGYRIVVSHDKSYMSWLVDERDGRRYLDCVSQYASQALGWNHPALRYMEEEVGKVAKHKIANSDFYTQEKARFVKDMAEVLPDFENFFFVEGGSVAVENALKAAFDWKAQKMECPQDFTPEFDVVHFKNAFHGRTGYAMSLTNTTPEKTRWFPTFRWTRVPCPAINLFSPEEHYQVEEETLLAVWQALVTKCAAAVIIEPIQGEGGDNQFSERFFRSLREMCDEHDTLLIFDEVQTGLGLTGKMWAYQHYGVVPDIIVFGKKTQVCGFAATNRINDVSSVFKVSSRINSTWGGNSVDMLRFSAIKKGIIDYKLVSSAEKVGDKLREGLRDIGMDNVRGLGLMVAFDMPSTQERDEMLERMEQRILALKCGPRSIRLRPHLSFSEDDAEIACGFIEQAIK